MRGFLLPVLLVLPAVLAVAADAANCAAPPTGRVPLVDLASGSYLGRAGGLYGGSNARPIGHEALGIALASAVEPRAASGLPAPGGQAVFLSIGMSNTAQESSAFAPLAAADPAKAPHVRFVNGAVGGYAAEDVASATSPYWALVDQRLASAGSTPAQVQVVWVKQSNRGPTAPFPQNADAFGAQLEDIVDVLRARFPNLLLVYLSSRIYAGYATSSLSPEPYAYESAFGVQSLVARHASGATPPVPWVSWGPYLWADGLAPRSDGLTWACSDLAADGTHPSSAGAAKVASLLHDFVRTDATARIWWTT